jgi:hypothetical protein
MTVDYWFPDPLIDGEVLVLLYFLFPHNNPLLISLTIFILLNSLSGGEKEPLGGSRGIFIHERSIE